MDYHKRLDIAEMFQEPPEYKPPGTAEQLACSVDYPNLNSQQYRMTRKPSPNILHPCLEHAARNANGQVILAGSDYMGRRWGSSFFGWENIEDVLNDAKISFKRQCRYCITAMQFTKDPNLFIIGTDKGSVELWSTRNEARGEGYSLYLVDGQSEHIEGVSAMDLIEGGESKLVTGSHDGCLKVWNYAADLHSVKTMTMAHTDAITGLSTNRADDSMFASSSLDRSALMWDLRKPRPASSLFEGHKFGFTTVYWTTKEEANQVVALGDEAGNVHFIDIRQPDVPTHSVKVFNKKIHKISFNGTQFVVLGDTNQARFYDENLALLHECTPATNYLRDVLWETGETKEKSTCWLVGWDTFIHKVEY